jgi:plastocyanin
MEKTVTNMRAGIVTVLLGCFLAACGGGGGDGYNPPTNPNPNPTPPSTSDDITVRDNSFQPSATTVPVGTVVTWTWTGQDIHNVTFGGGGPTSGDQTNGDTYQRTFNAAGTFSYSCTRHAGMNGSVTVQ